MLFYTHLSILIEKKRHNYTKNYIFVFFFIAYYPYKKKIIHIYNLHLTLLFTENY